VIVGNHGYPTATAFAPSGGNENTNSSTASFAHLEGKRDANLLRQEHLARRFTGPRELSPSLNATEVADRGSANGEPEPAIPTGGQTHHLLWKVMYDSPSSQNQPRDLTLMLRHRRADSQRWRPGDGR
jgi:hypothetical protein